MDVLLMKLSMGMDVLLMKTMRQSTYGNKGNLARPSPMQNGDVLAEKSALFDENFAESAPPAHINLDLLS